MIVSASPAPSTSTGPSSKAHATASNKPRDAVLECFAQLKSSAVKLKAENIAGLVARLEEIEEQALKKDMGLAVYVPRVLPSKEDVSEYLASEDCPRRYRWMQCGDDILIKFMPSPHEAVAHEVFRGLTNVFNENFPQATQDHELAFLGCPLHSYISETSKLMYKKEPDGAIWPPEVAEDMLPTVVIEAGVSQTVSALRIDLEWWKEKARLAAVGKLMLILLVDVDMKRRLVTFYFHPGPTFALDASRTTEMSLDDNPKPMQLSFKLEWLYGEVPAWAGQVNELVLNHDRMMRIRTKFLNAIKLRSRPSV